MQDWSSATKETVVRAIEEVARHAGPKVWAAYSGLLLDDPYMVSIERFSEIGRVFVIARMPHRVVYFEDIEEEFGTATKVDGRLTDCSIYGDLRLALKEAAAGA